mgnify:CR=1 FL=1
MANWLEHSVQIEVDAPIDLVWELWSDLEQMPRWMKWICLLYTSDAADE